MPGTPNDCSLRTALRPNCARTTWVSPSSPPVRLRQGRSQRPSSGASSWPHFACGQLSSRVGGANTPIAQRADSPTQPIQLLRSFRHHPHYSCYTIASLRGLDATWRYAGALNREELRLLGAWRHKATGRYHPPSRATLHRAVTDTDPDTFQATLNCWMARRQPSKIALPTDGKRHHLPSRLPPGRSRSSELCHGPGRSDPCGRRAWLSSLPEPSPVATPRIRPSDVGILRLVPGRGGPIRVPMGPSRPDSSRCRWPPTPDPSSPSAEDPGDLISRPITSWKTLHE